MALLIDMDEAALAGALAELGQPKFRAKQILQGFMQGKRLEDMSNLPRTLIEALTQAYPQGVVKVLERRTSRRDGTVKYLWELYDGEWVEGVLLSYAHGNTLCISTQVGCAMGCRFCASGQDGLIRDLSHGEMLAQVYNANAECATKEQRGITNIVLMGSGEPLQNYDNTVAFLRRVSDPAGLGVSPRNISVSTCGLPNEMRALAQEGLPVNLCVSLHSADDLARSALMPINKVHPLPRVIDAARYYARVTGRRVIFEYALIEGENDSPQAAQALRDLIHGFPAHINVIPLNAAKGSQYVGAQGKAADAFAARLEGLGLSATRRRTMGEDIEGACGQLRRRRMEAD